MVIVSVAQMHTHSYSLIFIFILLREELVQRGIIFLLPFSVSARQLFLIRKGLIYGKPHVFIFENFLRMCLLKFHPKKICNFKKHCSYFTYK